MKRNPRKLAWTKAFRRARGKELVVDTSLQFAARRNIPVRYDRTLVEKTLKGMERVEEVRQRRERRFYKERMRGNRERELELDRKLVEEHEGLLRGRFSEGEGVELDQELVAEGLPVTERMTAVEGDDFGGFDEDEDVEDESESESESEREVVKSKQAAKQRQKQKIKQKVRVDGKVDHVMDTN